MNKRFHCVVEGLPERILTGPETWEEAVRHPQFPHFSQSQINFLAFALTIFGAFTIGID